MSSLCYMYQNDAGVGKSLRYLAFGPQRQAMMSGK